MFSGIVQQLGEIKKISTQKNVKTFDLMFQESQKQSKKRNNRCTLNLHRTNIEE